MKNRIVIVLSLILCLTIVLTACGGSKQNTPSVQINSPDDFPGHKIAVQVDTTAAYSLDDMIAKGAKNIEVDRYDKVTQCFDDLALGRVDAVYVDSVVASYYTVGSDKYKRAWINSVGEPMGMCLPKSSDKLAAAVEASIDTMFFDGSMAQIAQKNFGEDFTAGLRTVTSQPVIPTDFTTITPGKLMVGSEIGYPPMEYKADNGIDNIGFDIDVGTKVAELLGLQVQFVDTAWDGIFFGLDKGEYDIIISSVSITPDRQAKYILTEPYVSNALCIVVRAN